MTIFSFIKEIHIKLQLVKVFLTVELSLNNEIEE